MEDSRMLPGVFFFKGSQGKFPQIGFLPKPSSRFNNSRPFAIHSGRSRLNRNENFPERGRLVYNAPLFCPHPRSSPASLSERDAFAIVTSIKEG
jgi:hypothetical protein